MSRSALLPPVQTLLFAIQIMPPRTAQMAQVGRRTLELSNLTKVLYPDDHIVKAELIEYYLKIAPSILAHVKGRPLSVVRYPDGIGGESFFQKNRPEWAPEWLEHVTLGEEKKDYVIATEDASLVWLANLACIELHQMHSRAPHFERPDYIVYDLDPPEAFRFSDVAGLASEFREHLERFGYHPFVKTTGRKGLHILTPIEPKWGFDKAFEAAKAIAQPFVDSSLVTDPPDQEGTSERQSTAGYLSQSALADDRIGLQRARPSWGAGLDTAAMGRVVLHRIPENLRPSLCSPACERKRGSLGGHGRVCDRTPHGKKLAPLDDWLESALPCPLRQRRRGSRRLSDQETFSQAQDPGTA